jgi:hypothetical protein
MEYIYTTHSLTNCFCNKIMNYYDNDDENLKYQGITFRGLDKRIKDATDLVIPLTNDINNKWYEINNILSSELEKNLKIYIKKLNNKSNYKEENNYGNNYNHLYEDLQLLNNFMIQKYEKNIGKYSYHDDGAVNTILNKHRVITYLWYLNDVEEGGETEFFGGDFKVKPEKGKLLFFPSFWCFPHRGNQPKSSNKYIITGWLYVKSTAGTVIKNIPYISESNTVFVLNENKEKNDNNENNDIITLKTVDEKKITIGKQENYLVFEFFYKLYPFIFKDYKRHLSQEQTYMEDIIIKDTYSKNICLWLIKEINSCKEIDESFWVYNENINIKYIELKLFQKTVPFVISSFEIICDIIKFKYKLNDTLNFNIKEWYAVKHLQNNNTVTNLFENKNSDIVIQIVLSEFNDNNELDDTINGDIFVTKTAKYLKKSKFTLIFFVDFTIKYFNNKNEIINLSIKEISDKNMNLINI